MADHAAITVQRPPDEVRQLWSSDYLTDLGAGVSFVDAPGDRGTEIHVELAEPGSAGKLVAPVKQVAVGPQLAKVKDELRRFKQRVETGEVPRSDGSPEGETATRKLKQRPAQPPAEKVGA